MRRATALAGAILALLLCAAVALAATPSKGLHKGTSSQDRTVDVKVGRNHHIRRFRIDWNAACDKPGKSWTDGTTVTNPDKQPGDGSFSASGKYKSSHPVGAGYVGHFNYGLSGKFTTKSDANGTFHVKVRVTKDGQTVDHCRTGKLTWQVS